jgi:hypothetical protein
MSEKDVAQILAAAEQAAKLRDAVGKTWNVALKAFDDHLDSLAAAKGDVSSRALFAADDRDLFTQDYPAQRKLLKEHARELSSSTDKVISILQRIIEKGVEYSAKQTFRYHPDVILASRNEILALIKAAQIVFMPPAGKA